MRGYAFMQECVCYGFCAALSRQPVLMLTLLHCYLYCMPAVYSRDLVWLMLPLLRSCTAACSCY